MLHSPISDKLWFNSCWAEERRQELIDKHQKAAKDDNPANINSLAYYINSNLNFGIVSEWNRKSKVSDPFSSLFESKSGFLPSFTSFKDGVADRFTSTSRRSIFDEKLPPAQFLGWNTAGTQIWARLTMAGEIRLWLSTVVSVHLTASILTGLDVKPVCSWDLRKIIFKIKCPQWRLEEVAELLNLKLKSRDGSMKKFRISKRESFVSFDDNEGKSSPTTLEWSRVTRCSCVCTAEIDLGDNFQKKALFRSSERQQIIDHIIKTKIRDGGAELDENSLLGVYTCISTVTASLTLDVIQCDSIIHVIVGRKIRQRFPLHMDARLCDLRYKWITFWKTDRLIEYRNRQGNRWPLVLCLSVYLCLNNDNCDGTVNLSIWTPHGRLWALQSMKRTWSSQSQWNWSGEGCWDSLWTLSKNTTVS